MVSSVKQNESQHSITTDRTVDVARASNLLSGVAKAAQHLLSIVDFDAAVDRALEAIATSANVDRIFILQHHLATNAAPEFATCPYEWTASGIPVHREVPGRFPMVYGEVEGFSEWVQALKAGEPVQKLKKEMSAKGQALQDIDQALSVLTVPIFVAGEYWGNFGFDDCTTERVWSESEIAALETAAACISSAIERDLSQKARMAEVEAHNRALAERDRILEATAAAANVMLTDEDFGSAVSRAIEIVGEGLSVDRAALMQHFEASRNNILGYHEVVREWTAADVVSQGEHPELNRISDDGVEFLDELWHGEVTGGVVDELPEPFRSGQIALGVKSTYAVPVMVEGFYWGLIGLDDCQYETRRSEAELEALMTLANCIGSAIEQDRNRKARERAERTAIIERERAARAAELEAANKVLTVRDRWLQTTATAAKELLSTTDINASVQKALATIGENLECDRLDVMRYRPNYNSHPLGALEILYEWDAEGIRPQIEDSRLSIILPQGFEDWFEQVLAGEWVGGNVSDLPEPARSGQKALGVLSTYAIPIFIDEALWGIVGMDYCREEKQLSEPELAVFKTAATCVGSAIYQAQVRRDKAARERAAELAKTNEAIGRTLETLATNPELDNFLCLLVKELSEIVGAHNTGLFLFNAETNMLRRHVSIQDGKAYKGKIPRDTEMLQHPFPANVTDFWRTVVEAERPVTFLEMDSPDSNSSNLWWEDTIDWHISEGHQEFACARLKVGDIPLGFIGFCFREHIAFSDEKLELVQALANQATLAIQLTRLAEEAKQAAVLQEQEKAASQRAAELAKTNEAIGQTLNTLTTTPQLDQFLGQILTQIIKQVDASYANLFLYDEETHTLNSHISLFKGTVYPGAAPEDPDIFRESVPADITSFWQTIVNSSAPLILDENYPDTADFYWPTTLEWHQSQGHLSSACLCLRIGDKPIGFVGFAFCHLSVLTTEQLEFIQALTNQAALSIHLTQLAEQSKSAALSIALTEERNRLAREIHDTLAQAFTGVSLQLEAARSALTKAAASIAANYDPLPPAFNQTQTFILRARDLSRQGLSEARRSVRALRSQALETDTLPTALRKILNQISHDTHLDTQFYLEGTPAPLPDDIQLHLLRISQEAITNTLRHAQATQIDLTLAFESGEIQLRIVDDGIGFTPSLQVGSGFGLIGMRERTARFHGTFQLLSSPGVGTTIEITVPLPTAPPIPPPATLPP